MVQPKRDVSKALEKVVKDYGGVLERLNTGKKKKH